MLQVSAWLFGSLCCFTLGFHVGGWLMFFGNSRTVAEHSVVCVFLCDYTQMLFESFSFFRATFDI